MELVDRQAVIDAILSHLCDDGDKDKWAHIIEDIWLKDVPTVTDLSGYSDKLWAKAVEYGRAQERKTGRWTDNNACPFCGFQPWYERDIHTLSFCPNCGAKMEK
ncbi:MAG: hypothetical protein K5637_01875 [Lachnospiraceae bacterium]|nr:hypothetical protein [Lachnospiraceae bacterium]